MPRLHNEPAHNPDTAKICKDCRKSKPPSEFYLCMSRGTRRLQSYCKPCTIERAKRWCKDNKDRVYESARVRTYGLSRKQIDEMKVTQNHRCLLCGRSGMPLCVDHSHSSGKVRGLVCTQCNTGIAMFKDNPILLRRAIEYLGYKP